MKQAQTARCRIFGLFLLLFLLKTSLFAGVMVCEEPDPAHPGNLSPGAGCIAVIDTSTVLSAGTTCFGPFRLVVRTLGGDTIVVGTNLVAVPVLNYLNTVIEIEVTHLASGNSCSSYFFVEDKQPPTVSCPSDTIVCTASLAPADIKPIILGDNCDAALTTLFSDVTLGPDCSIPDPTIIAVRIRHWTVTDDHNNSASCFQNIYILRADTADVVFPADITIDCASPSANPAVTGRPTIEGNPILGGGLCNLVLTFSDDTTQTTCGQPLIVRTWTVLDVCTDDFKSESQIIFYNDTTVPVITCPASLVFPTAPGICDTTITLPLPSVSDNCSSYSVSVNTPGLGAGFTLPHVTIGLYTVTYTATDACGNVATCQTSIAVQDNETPTAICDGFKVVSIPSFGMVTLAAAAFDEGSYDNCDMVAFMVSRDGLPFANTVKFDCDDVGDTIMVTLMVKELGDTTSFTNCMNQVVVQDKQPPMLICPPNQTIDCEANYTNLAIFGQPTVSDNCNYSITSDSTISINNCGVGTINRVWMAVDSSGNSITCSQTITVINQTPYNGSTIQWPSDYTVFHDCSAPLSLLPPDLPTAPINYSAPTVPGSTCAMIATSYTDQLFNVSFPACYKIVRTWKVMDWCQYNPANPTVGLWTKQQLIIVMDSIPPVITYCPPATSVSLNNTCTFGEVVLFPVTATDCSPDITITNNSPFALSGNNASGQYPAGVYNITFTAKDGCGNKSTCATTITVKDLKKPTPYCNTGIVGELQLMAGQPMVMVPAIEFNNNSYDNCTAASNLDFTIRLVGDTLPPTASLLTFDCDGEGEHLVEIWVTDQAGNSDYCITNLIIQDNMDVCPNDTLPDDPMIAGLIETEMGSYLADVTVNVTATPMTASTGSTGTFELYGFQNGGNYTVVPEKNTSPKNGVTTYDLVLMSRHILGVTTLTSPYKIIAADINHSGAVTTADIVELRRLILQIYDHFPQNTSWRFVRKDYVFPNPTNPFNPPFPEALEVDNINQDMSDADFIAVKIGDLNCSAATNFGNNVGDRSSAGAVAFLTNDHAFIEGEEFVVPISSKAYHNLLALQFTMEFETGFLELQGIEKGVLPLRLEDHFGQARRVDGILTAAWFELEPIGTKPDETLFSLRFRAKAEGRLSETLRFNSRFTEAMAYDENETARPLTMQYINENAMTATTDFQLFQNQPNPFKKATRISFILPEEGQAKLNIYDLSGKLLKSIDSTYPKGYNEVNLVREELPVGGVLFYKLESQSYTATKKMILLN